MASALISPNTRARWCWLSTVCVTRRGLHAPPTLPVASQCGFTPQYKSLQSVFSKYSKDGLVVLAFPCNQVLSWVAQTPLHTSPFVEQFGGQEPGSNSEIKSFAARQGATFPVMAKVDVNGANGAHATSTTTPPTHPPPTHSRPLVWLPQGQAGGRAHQRHQVELYVACA